MNTIFIVVYGTDFEGYSIVSAHATVEGALEAAHDIVNRQSSTWAEDPKRREFEGSYFGRWLDYPDYIEVRKLEVRP